MIIYCLKCKQKTDTTNNVEVKSKNGRAMIKGNCSICGTKKSVFISSTASTASTASSSTAKKPKKTIKGKGGFSLNNLINNLPIEFHQYADRGEFVPGGSFNDQQKYSSVVRVPDTNRE